MATGSRGILSSWEIVCPNPGDANGTMSMGGAIILNMVKSSVRGMKFFSEQPQDDLRGGD